MTDITKQALEAAHAHILDAYRIWQADDISAVPPSGSSAGKALALISAALSRPIDNAGEARVPSLEWTGEEGGPGRDIYATPSGYHHYTVRHLSDGRFDVILHTDTGSIWFKDEKDGVVHPSYEAAKGFAQADYNLRGAQFLSALTQAEKAGVGDGWRPIETAPKDGTKILAWSAFWDKHHLVRWNSDENAWCEGSWCFGSVPDMFWQPLPEPTNALRQGRKEAE